METRANEEEAGDAGETFELTVKWNGQEMSVLLESEETVSDLKRRLSGMTRVEPKRQKFVGLKDKAGHIAKDESAVEELNLGPKVRIMMLGTPEEAIEELDAALKAGDVVDDLGEGSDDGSGRRPRGTTEPASDPGVRAKLERRISAVKITLLNPPRPGKKLLVLDIDYTIFDLSVPAELPMERARPHLHAFLASAYVDYDIVFWSATSLRWMQAKLQSLNVLEHPDWKVACMLDCKSMLTVHSQQHGVFDCKPLELLWQKFPDAWNASNTIMLDDLRRNFILNRANGLVIRPFQRLRRSAAMHDQELIKLKYYLRAIARQPSLEGLKHKHWERYLEQQLLADEASEMTRELQEDSVAFQEDLRRHQL